MRRMSLVSLSVVAAAAGALFVRGAGAADPVAGAQGRTAVVDVVALLNAAPRKRVIEGDNLKRKQEIEKYAEDEQERIKDMRKQILAKPDADPIRRKLETDYARAKVVFEFDMKVKVADAEAAYSSALETLFEEVKGATRQVAEEQGFVIVMNLVTDRLDLRDSPGGFVANVAARPVLYASNSLDITNLVKAKLTAASPPSPMPGPAPVGPAPAPRPQLPPAPGAIPAPMPLPAPSGPGALPPPSAPGMNAPPK